MSLEPAVQRAAGEPERLRRVAHVAGRARQRLLNEHPLHVLEAHLVERRGTVRPGAEPQVARSYRALLGHQHGPLDRVVELPHVPGPGIRPEGLHRVRREAANRLPVTRGVAAPEMAGEQGNVLAPLAQRWQAEFDRIEAKQQVLSEFPRRRFGMDVGVRGRDDADVHALRLGRADALELARLEHAQQLRLLRQGPMRSISLSTGSIAGDSAISSGRPSRRNARFSRSSCWLRRNALPSSTWVRSVASSRRLSHGFSMKSRAPRRIASTAPSMLAQAVITTTRGGASSAWSRASKSRPSAPEVVSRA